jgi:predicted DCC family thiol-disulfide oxidoreductase YuxK
MTHNLDDNQLVLLYRSTCKRCRILSGLVIALSLGIVRRIPNNSNEAKHLIKVHQLNSSRVILIEGSRVHNGFHAIIVALKTMCHKFAFFLSKLLLISN